MTHNILCCWTENIMVMHLAFFVPINEKNHPKIYIMVVMKSNQNYHCKCRTMADTNKYHMDSEKSG